MNTATATKKTKSSGKTAKSKKSTSKKKGPVWEIEEKKVSKKMMDNVTALNRGPLATAPEVKKPEVTADVKDAPKKKEKKPSKTELMVRWIEKNGGLTKKEIVERLVSELDIKEGTASTIFCTCQNVKWIPKIMIDENKEMVVKDKKVFIQKKANAR